MSKKKNQKKNFFCENEKLDYTRFLEDFYYHGTLILPCIRGRTSIRNWVTFCEHDLWIIKQFQVNKLWNEVMVPFSKYLGLGVFLQFWLFFAPFGYFWQNSVSISQFCLFLAFFDAFGYFYYFWPLFKIFRSLCYNGLCQRWWNTGPLFGLF